MLKITLDPGHVQGANIGAVAGYREGTTMFAMAQELKGFLEEYEGVQVFCTRAKPTDDPSLEARGRAAIQNGSEVFLSLHSDASGNKNVRGVTAIRSLKRPDSVALGRALAAAACGAMGCGLSPYAGADDGVWTKAYPGVAGTDYYGVIRAAAKGAGVKYIYLLEHSFHTNPTDCATLDASAARQRVAKAEAQAIAAYFGLRPKGADGGRPVLYRFCTGAMTKGDAAKYRAALQNLQADTGVGFSESQE